jgi:hypothetical protein
MEWRFLFVIFDFDYYLSAFNYLFSIQTSFAVFLFIIWELQKEWLNFNQINI